MNLDCLLREILLRFSVRFWSATSSETQGQIKGARESLNGRKNIYGTKKSKERREEPLGTMSYQTSSKRSPPFWLLIGARKTQVFWHQSQARTAATVWNWSGKTLSPGALLAVLYFSSFHIFSRPFRLFLVPTICPWVSEDGSAISAMRISLTVLLLADDSPLSNVICFIRRYPEHARNRPNFRRSVFG